MDSAYVGLIGGLGGATIVGYLSFATQAYMHDRSREKAKREDYRLKLFEVFSTVSEAFSATIDNITVNELGLKAVKGATDVNHSYLEGRIEVASDRHMNSCNKASASTLTLKLLHFDTSTKLAQDLISNMYDINGLAGNRRKKEELALLLKNFIDQIKIDYDSLF